MANSSVDLVIHAPLLAVYIKSQKLFVTRQFNQAHAQILSWLPLPVPSFIHHLPNHFSPSHVSCIITVASIKNLFELHLKVQSSFAVHNLCRCLTIISCPGQFMHWSTDTGTLMFWTRKPSLASRVLLAIRRSRTHELEKVSCCHAPTRLLPSDNNVMLLMLYNNFYSTFIFLLQLGSPWFSLLYIGSYKSNQSQRLHFYTEWASISDGYWFFLCK